MRFLVESAGAALLALAGGLVRAQDPAPAPQAEFDQLVADFGAAQQEYYEPYQQAKSEEESRRIQLDPAKDPRKLYVPRFEELAARTKESEIACQCRVWVFSNSCDDAAMKRSFAALRRDHVRSPRLEGFVQPLGWYAPQLGRSEVDELLDTLVAESPHEAVRAAALFTQASIVFQDRGCGAEAKASAHAKLERVRKDFAKTRYAAQAEGLLFEADHLQIGMIAPDFEAIDQDGQPWKLSDYRGKVVVVDFWGYW